MSFIQAMQDAILPQGRPGWCPPRPLSNIFPPVYRKPIGLHIRRVSIAVPPCRRWTAEICFEAFESKVACCNSAFQHTCITCSCYVVQLTVCGRLSLSGARALAPQ